MTLFPRYVAATLTSAILALGSCSQLGSPTFASLTAALKVAKFEAKNHHLLLVSNKVLVESPTNLHIYLEGDGLPWRNRHTISKDPTPRYPLALHLMSLDPDPAYYITRPCYHRQISENCHDDLWTFGRYSQEVVDAMAQAVQSILASVDESTTVTLIGYSGGATLALLVVAQLEGVDRLVTVAGNLDNDAWTALHGYTPLHNSLNPANIELPEYIRYIHFAGSDDSNIPPSLGKAMYARPGHELRVMQGFDHRCCWVEVWPQVLTEIKKQ